MSQDYTPPIEPVARKKWLAKLQRVLGRGWCIESSEATLNLTCYRDDSADESWLCWGGDPADPVAEIVTDLQEIAGEYAAAAGRLSRMSPTTDTGGDELLATLCERWSAIPTDAKQEISEILRHAFEDVSNIDDGEAIAVSCCPIRGTNPEAGE